MSQITTPRHYTTLDVARALGMNPPAVRYWLRVRVFPEHSGHYWMNEEQYQTALRVIRPRRKGGDAQ